MYIIIISSESSPHGGRIGRESHVHTSSQYLNKVFQPRKSRESVKISDSRYVIVLLQVNRSIFTFLLLFSFSAPIRSISSPDRVKHLKGTSLYIISYLYSLISIGQQGNQHIDKKDDSHDKETGVENSGKFFRREIYGIHGIKIFCYPQQRPAQMSNHRPPTAK